MKIKVLKTFKDKLNRQIEYIARDKPHAARKFKSELLKRIKEIPLMPYKNRKSIFLPTGFYLILSIILMVFDRIRKLISREQNLLWDNPLSCHNSMARYTRQFSSLLY